MENFWETEKPMIADTGKNVIEYFPDAGKLSISKPSWTDKEGNEKRGKTVLLDLAAAAATPAAVRLLEDVVKTLRANI